MQGLLTRDPLTRLGTVRDAEEVMEHPFFAGVDWHAILQRRAKPPFSPEIVAGTTDTRFFDEQFTKMPVGYPVAPVWHMLAVSCEAHHLSLTGMCVFLPITCNTESFPLLVVQITASIQAQTRLGSHERTESTDVFSGFTYEEASEYLGRTSFGTLWLRLL